MRVDPVAGSVAVEFAPVVVPGFGAVKGFGDVVVAFAVAGAVEEFVGCAGWGGGDEVLQVGGEELPGGGGGGVFWEVGVGTGDKAEVVSCLEILLDLELLVMGGEMEVRLPFLPEKYSLIQ